MNILLLGGSGFVGEYLCKKISERDGHNLTVVGINDIGESKIPGIEYKNINLAEDSPQLGELVNTADIIVILTQPDEKIIRNLTAAIKPDSPLKKIVYLSTVLLYGDSPDPQKEDSPLVPMTAYENGKSVEEKLLKQFVEDNSLKLCIPRLSNVYGDKKNRGLMNYIFLALLNNVKFTVNGQGDSVRDYIFVEDVAAWLDFLIFREPEDKIEIFNLSTGKGYSISQALEEVEKVTGKNINKEYGPAVAEKKSIIGDNQKIRELSKISPKYDFSSGLKKTFENYSKTQ